VRISPWFCRPSYRIHIKRPVHPLALLTLRTVLCDKKGVKKLRKFTAIIEKEGRWFIAQCPELDIASQGKSVKEAQQNLREAVELFFRHASPSEIADRLKSEVIVTQMVVSVG
jgi:predicted RNase H-like HicB family nuclease